MKNTLQRSLALFAFILLFAFSGSVKAQILSCPYYIKNATGCAITIDFQVSCGATLCPVAAGITIPANSTYVIPCSVMDSCCPGPWDCSVTITDFAGVPVSTSQTVDSGTPGPLSWGPCAPGVPVACCMGTSFKIAWGSTSTLIN